MTVNARMLLHLALALLLVPRCAVAENIVWDSFDSPETLLKYGPAPEATNLRLQTAYTGPAEYRKAIVGGLDLRGGSDGTLIEVTGGTLTAFAPGLADFFVVQYGSALIFAGEVVHQALDLDLSPDHVWEVDYTMTIGDLSGPGQIVMDLCTYDGGSCWSAGLSVDAEISDGIHTVSFPVSMFASPHEGFSLDDVDVIQVFFTDQNSADRPFRVQVHEIRLVPEPSTLCLLLSLIPLGLWARSMRHN